MSGELGIIQNTIGMFGTLAGFGMGLTANKHVAEFKRTDPAPAERILGLACGDSNDYRPRNCLHSVAAFKLVKWPDNRVPRSTV